MASGQQIGHAACEYCGRDFCDRQSSAEDLVECYRIAYLRIEAELLAAEKVTDWLRERMRTLETALKALHDAEARG